ncbi:ATP-binding protein [Sphingobium xenophagum]|uniref:ATP-binding protein n=1 Tax=Sphingobium xenophagum TaxID=121428 RepID=UPI00035F6073|nr:YhaN family protein [Sphingobium xenophagum]
MRFVNLSLERYGHFEDCTLSFRNGQPDLHVIYGANEAGKTTSLAAVSDLLFGFPVRSPYNFMYDYSLLRVGAVLEDEGATLACRRKKAPNASLLGPDDRPIDEGALLAMLRGQTRETFGLSFSLDQEGLRAGGKAMVEARNDLGRALFAAGSGLTGVSDELARLEEEADAIWGPRASNRRSFTVAQRELEAGLRSIRDRSLRPRIWTDARAAVATAQAALDEAQRRRDELLAEMSRAERIRRIAPSARLRAEHQAAIEAHGATIELAAQREEAAEAAMAEAASAGRAKAAAAKLAEEAAERVDALVADEAIMAQADLVDALVSASGAVAKASSDMVRLRTEHATRTGRIERLREEAGALAADPPSRIASARLRELALSHVEDRSALAQIAQSEEELDERRRAASGIPRKADDDPNRDLGPVIAAVDAARALGADIDARCQSLRRAADTASTTLAQSLSRLAPWSGGAATLLELPRIGQAEIDEARTAMANLSAEAERETTEAGRARDEAAALSLQMEQLASGNAVSAEEIQSARTARNEHWRPLRDHILAEAPVAAPHEAVTVFEATLAEADQLSDLRFAAADESSRLADMQNRVVKLMLDAEQAELRAKGAEERVDTKRSAWRERLEAAGHVEMEPTRLVAWNAARDVSEAAYAASVAAMAEAGAADVRRAKVRQALASCLPEGATPPDAYEIAPILAIAERLRADLEAAEQQRRLDEAAAARIEQDADTLGRRRKRLEDAAADREAQWRQQLEQTGLDLELGNATAALDILEELRVEIEALSDLQGRLDGMERDAADHGARVHAAADTLGIAVSENPEERLTALRSRLTSARATAKVIDALKATMGARNEEVAAEDARLAAAMDSLRSLMEETGSEGVDELAAAIARSRAVRALRGAVADAETAITSAGDGKGLAELLGSLDGVDPDGLAAKTQTLASQLADLNAEVDAAAGRLGDARRAFANLEQEGESAIDAATDAGQARAELAVLSEQYILKRAQAVTLRWAIERYREQHQDPMLLRASELFSILTIGRYAALRIDSDAASPRLLGVRNDGRTVVEVGAMSEGTTDQLFLALRLAAVEQSVAAGVRLPFLADDLFVNFDDDRSEAGFRVLAELARSTQVLFFTHHPHLASIARSVVGADIHSECTLG